ncbi:hypothetical protein [Nocardia cyriacigeorgica]|uniref:hypothetical protein n=1 Tax=Nocardia cyriacigeorgica TaxID=135487 RepID=UPI00245712AC|nr:hypothetical protein [Nocardia cyriacigeorgica]
MASSPSVRSMVSWVLLSVATAGCFVVGAWHWNRLGSVSGVDHNAGYALLWPAFGMFLLVAALAHRHRSRSVAGDAESAANRLKVAATRELPPGLLPGNGRVIAEPDAATAAYNTYLAALNDRELQRRLRDAGLDCR